LNDEPVFERSLSLGRLLFCAQEYGGRLPAPRRDAVGRPGPFSSGPSTPFLSFLPIVRTMKTRLSFSDRHPIIILARQPWKGWSSHQIVRAK